MSDQGMFQRNINSDGAAAQAFAEAGAIASTTSVAVVDTTAGDVAVSLPDQLAAAGMTITVVKLVAANILTIGVTDPLNSLDGAADGSVDIIAGTAYGSLTFVSTGDSWANIG